MLAKAKTLESAEDITAAETAPRPKKATTGGVRYRKTIGRIIASCWFSSGVELPYAVAVQSVTC